MVERQERLDDAFSRENSNQAQQPEHCDNGGCSVQKDSQRIDGSKNEPERDCYTENENCPHSLNTFQKSRRHTGLPQENLTGQVTPHCDTALILIDVINGLEFEGNEFIVKESHRIANNILALKTEAKKMDIPVIYVNDNFGRWKSDKQGIIEHATSDKCGGSYMSKILVPEDDDYFIIKPKHSAFYCTTLDVLLQHLKVRTLIMAGVAGNICILFSANDAYMRDFALFVPEDCIASNSKEENDSAIQLMKKILKADTSAHNEIDWGKICNLCSPSKPHYSFP